MQTKLSRLRRSIRHDKAAQTVAAQIATRAVIVRDRLLLDRPQREAGEVKAEVDTTGEIVAFFNLKEDGEIFRITVAKLPEGSEL